MDKIVNYVISLGVGCRHPKDALFREGDDINKVHKVFGVYDVDDEEFYHKPYPVFSCHVPGCTVSCHTVYEYEQHYNSYHRYSCIECNKYLPSSHLLDLHLMEKHDAYFAALSEKKPMFQCYVQECKSVFQTPQQRRDHCIKSHKFPPNFRFDNYLKKKGKRKDETKLKKGQMDAEMGENYDESEKMDISEENEKSVGGKKSSKMKNFSFGHRRGPKLSSFQCFAKDLKESLPT